MSGVTLTAFIIRTAKGEGSWQLSQVVSRASAAGWFWLLHSSWPRRLRRRHARAHLCCGVAQASPWLQR